MGFDAHSAEAGVDSGLVGGRGLDAGGDADAATPMDSGGDAGPDATCALGTVDVTFGEAGRAVRPLAATEDQLSLIGKDANTATVDRELESQRKVLAKLEAERDKTGRRLDASAKASNVVKGRRSFSSKNRAERDLPA